MKQCQLSTLINGLNMCIVPANMACLRLGPKLNWLIFAGETLEGLTSVGMKIQTSPICRDYTHI